MSLFIEKGIRGGVAMMGHRYAKANNVYLSTYDSSLPSSYIIYLDANNLYAFRFDKQIKNLLLLVPKRSFVLLEQDLRPNFKTNSASSPNQQHCYCRKAFDISASYKQAIALCIGVGGLDSFVQKLHHICAKAALQMGF
ncbi:hypothetical protein TNCV_1162181 [Trichonephila clavipes]|nr:hypothetical protein TNCV_1162181 [Trichonephila clavipes]